jgi:hypothetical protein
VCFCLANAAPVCFCLVNAAPVCFCLVTTVWFSLVVFCGNMHNPRKDDRQSVQPCSPGSRQMTIVYKTTCEIPGESRFVVH